MRVAETKALISFAVTAKLICAFVFAYAECWFSHGAALCHIDFKNLRPLNQVKMFIFKVNMHHENVVI